MKKKDYDAVELVDIHEEPVSGIEDDGTVRITADLVLGPNRTLSLSMTPSEKDKLIGAITHLANLEPGDEVTQPGANGAEDVSGTVLHHDRQSNRVAWVHTSTGSPLISERHRLVRTRKAEQG